MLEISPEAVFWVTVAFPERTISESVIARIAPPFLPVAALPEIYPPSIVSIEPAPRLTADAISALQEVISLPSSIISSAPIPER